MGSEPQAAENTNRLERLPAIIADRLQTDEPVETMRVGQCRRSKTMTTTITSTVPPRGLQPPVLLSDEEIESVAGGGFWGAVGGALVGAVVGALSAGPGAVLGGAAVGAVAGAAFGAKLPF
jgi:hypothetical protein